MTNFWIILKSKFNKKQRIKNIDKLEKELGLIEDDDIGGIRDSYCSDGFILFIAGFGILVFGCLCIFIGFLNSLVTFMWETGGMFTKIFIMCMITGCVLILLYGIYEFIETK